MKSFFLYVTLTEATLLWRSSPWPAVAWITWAVLLSLATINFGDGRDMNQKRKRQTRTLAAIIFIAATVLLFVQVL